MANLLASKTLPFLLIAASSLALQACNDPGFRLGLPGAESLEQPGKAPAPTQGKEDDKKKADKKDADDKPKLTDCKVIGTVETALQQPVLDEAGKPVLGDDKKPLLETVSSLHELAKLEEKARVKPVVTSEEDRLERRIYDGAKELGLDHAGAMSLALSHKKDRVELAPVTLADGGTQVRRLQAHYYAFVAALDVTEKRFPKVDEALKDDARAQAEKARDLRRAATIGKLLKTANPLAAVAAFEGVLVDATVTQRRKEALGDEDIAFAERVATSSRPEQLLLMYREYYGESRSVGSDVTKAHDYAVAQACLQKDQRPVWPDEEPKEEPKKDEKKADKKAAHLMNGMTVPKGLAVPAQSLDSASFE